MLEKYNVEQQVAYDSEASSLIDRSWLAEVLNSSNSDSLLVDVGRQK